MSTPTKIKRMTTAPNVPPTIAAVWFFPGVADTVTTIALPVELEVGLEVVLEVIAVVGAPVALYAEN